jgi:hypothetical protein
MKPNPSRALLPTLAGPQQNNQAKINTHLAFHNDVQFVTQMDRG